MKNISTSSLRTQGVLMIIILLFAANYKAKAQATWTGLGSPPNNWSDGTNWSGASGFGGVPDAGDDVIIPSGTISPIIDAGAVCQSITIASTQSAIVKTGYSLSVGGSITGLGSLNLGGVSGTVSGTVHVSGDFTIATLTSGSNSVVDLNGVSNQNLSANAFHDLNITGGASATLTGNITVGGTITGNGSLSNSTHNLSATGSVTGISFNGGSGTTTLAGNFGVNAFTCATSTVILVGTGRQLQNAFTFNNLQINNTSTSEVFFDDQTINGTLSGSGTLDGQTVNVNVKGDITVNVITPGTTKYFLSGSTANQSITKGYTFYELHINNTASTNPGATMTSGDVTVTHNLSLDAGILTLGANNLFISTPVTGITGTPGITKYIQTNSTGFLEWSAVSPGGTIFPVGDAAYNPIKIAPQTTDDFYDVTAGDGVTDAANHQATANGVNMTWTVKVATGGNSSQGVVVTPQWTTSQELPGFDHTSSSDDVQYRTNTSSAWTPTTAAAPANPSTNTYALASGNPGPSDITMITTGAPTYFLSVGNAAPLPVTLTAFNAIYKANAVNLDWQTASEINNSFFNIERSTDGQTWVVIGRTEGHGNSQVMNNYTAIDNLAGVIPAGTIYYRLKQVDFNGAFEYSMIKSVTISNNQVTVETYPNPANNVLNVSWTSAASQNSTLKILSLTGVTIYTENVSGEGLMNKQINLSALLPGTYLVQIASDNDLTTKMVYKN